MKKYDDLKIENKKEIQSLTIDQLSHLESIGYITTGINNITLWIGDKDYLYISNNGIDPKGKNIFKLNINTSSYDNYMNISDELLTKVLNFVKLNKELLINYSNYNDFSYLIKNIQK